MDWHRRGNWIILRRRTIVLIAGAHAIATPAAFVVNTLSRFSAALAVINAGAATAGRALAGALLAAMTLVVLAQVCLRFFANEALPWSEELAKSMMVWCAFAAAPWAYRAHALVAISSFLDALPRTMVAGLAALQSGLIIWICGVFVLDGMDFVNRGFDVAAASLPISVGYFYVIAPVSFAALGLIALERLAGDLAGLIDPSAQPPASDAMASDD